MASMWLPCWQRRGKVVRHAPMPKTTLGEKKRLSHMMSPPQGCLVRLVDTSQPYMKTKLTPKAILVTERCEEGLKVEAGQRRTLTGASVAAGSWGSRNEQWSPRLGLGSLLMALAALAPVPSNLAAALSNLAAWCC